MVFELHGQFIHRSASARAERRGPGFVVMTPAGRRRAHSLDRATRIACEVIGPLMEAGDKAGEGWGLVVIAGPASLCYGNWPGGSPAEPGPELPELARIIREYRPGDGARGALANACKVIDAFAGREGAIARAA
jgi:hypothetical protein